MPLWVKKKPSARAINKVEIVKGNANISDLIYNSHTINFKINAMSDTHIRVNTIFYPGWEIKVDNSPVTMTYNNEYGVMEFKAPSGKHTIQGQFKETGLRTISNLISLSTGILMLMLMLLLKAKRARIQKE
jgi:uncharacterized membrane protein YfhO